MNETLKKWRKVCEAATGGRWFVRTESEFTVKSTLQTEHPDDFVSTSWNKKEDAEFIALSRTALPVAIECLEMVDKALACTAIGEWCNNDEACDHCALKKQIHARLEACK